MEKVTFVNANEMSIEFGAQFPYLLGDVTGIAETPYMIQAAETYGLSGGIYYDTLAAARTIKFDFWFNAATHAGLHTARQTIQSILNPMLGTGQLIYENDIGKWCIPAVLFDGPVMLPKKPDDRKITYQHADVAFVCEQPFWQSFVEYSTMIIGRTGGLSFPLAFPVHFSDLADNIEINNTGDVDAPLRIEFRGPAAGCRITKVETGEYIEVSYTLAAGEKLIIDTDPRSTTVTFVDTHGVSVSAFNKINALSTFFQLTRGINTIAFTSVSGTPEVYLYWHELFSGV